MRAVCAVFAVIRGFVRTNAYEGGVSDTLTRSACRVFSAQVPVCGPFAVDSPSFVDLCEGTTYKPYKPESSRNGRDHHELVREGRSR
jgi:hypothetical protein